MTSKLNCWEYKNCGREKGGLMAQVLGECPVATYMKFDGLNDGIGAGRACWMALHSNESGINLSPGCGAKKCYCCEFYKRVVFEQEDKTCFKYASVDN